MTRLPLFGKKVLFFCPRTFNYEKEILCEMQKMGATVTFRSARPVENGWLIAFFRVFPLLAWYVSDRFYFSWLKKDAPEKCDIILVVKGEGLSPYFLRKLRSRYQNAKCVLYLWDSMRNLKYIESKLPFFDQCFSFDPSDCLAFPQLKYRPLFFMEKYLNKSNAAPGKGVFFMGTLNGDRPRVLANLLSALEKGIQLQYYLFVRSRVELAFRRMTDKYLRSLEVERLLYKPLSSETLIRHMKDCAAVLDIEHPKQTGLTMRTFEVIASGKKLITTNRSVVKHDFYDPDRILVIDREHPVVSNDFISSAVPRLSAEFVSRYSLQGWLSEILI